MNAESNQVFYSSSNIEKGNRLESIVRRALPSADFNGGNRRGWDFDNNNGVFIECRNHNGEKYSETYEEAVRRDNHRFNNQGEYKYVLIVGGSRYTAGTEAYYKRRKALIVPIPFVTEENKGLIEAYLHSILPFLTHCKTYRRAKKMLSVLLHGLPTKNSNHNYIPAEDMPILNDYVSPFADMIDDNHRLRHTDFAVKDAILSDAIRCPSVSVSADYSSLSLSRIQPSDAEEHLWRLW